MGKQKTQINFFSEGIEFNLKNKTALKKWIHDCIQLEGMEYTTISIIFTSDEYLKSLNVSYLNKKYLTDVITFPYSSESPISGDVFISIDRVKENAATYNQTFETELYRIIIHGILHLLGYKDKIEKDKANMTYKENKYVKLADSYAK